MQPEQYLDGQQDPMVEAIRTAIRCRCWSMTTIARRLRLMLFVGRV
jgi:hypothetical protein